MLANSAVIIIIIIIIIIIHDVRMHKILRTFHYDFNRSLL